MWNALQVSEPGETIDLDITDVAHGGVFVARHEGRVVFVPDAIPGERVRARLADATKASFWRAEALEVLDASPHRQPHAWRQADIDVPPEDRPGGADFGHIVLEHQRDLKLRVLQDALHRFGGLDVPAGIRSAEELAAVDELLGSDAVDGLRWRTRVSLHVDDAGRVGPYAARSHRVIPVDDLPLATADVEHAALALPGGEPGRIDLVQPADGRVRVLPRPEKTRDASPRRGRGGPRTQPHAPRRSAEVVIERVGDRDFRVDAEGFWQVHRHAASALTSLVDSSLRELAAGGQVLDPDAWHLDLYGGVGLFAATLGDLGGASTRVTSVESDARATEHAGENLAEWVGARAETGRVDRWLARLVAEASAAERERLSRGVVLLDPPRAGAGREVVQSVVELAPVAVVYVACDPVALARDLGTFRAAGYETARVDALDLFPNSHHVEAVAVLTRPGVDG
ncbi:class I SAM-dependent RNA methyltransferase [Microbacterium allomyrinae]|uniref:Class I SAM-dependent RNA methyltransferase n=1 Tax=Microbacterium allomyrinae TaxID=2830666 RepID=A0A9X1LWL2_9MICO|nr:TRAM domain-containing protein [Microbacterium allomyrinae]MCC2033384.1 class I SAM-dependent RNA methyltransferase [Microbacterium allomyrinae]